MLVEKTIIECDSCETVNDKDAKFCKECGLGKDETKSKVGTAWVSPDKFKKEWDRVQEEYLKKKYRSYQTKDLHPTYEKFV